MAFDVTIQHDLKKLKRSLNALKTRVAPQATVRTLSNAFIAPRKSGSSKTTVYMRKSKDRHPLKLLYGPGIMQLFRQKENDAIMQAKVKERFPIEFARNLKFYINPFKRRQTAPNPLD